MKFFKTTTITILSITLLGTFTPFSVSGENSKRKTITKKLISLLDKKPEIKDMLTKSIEKAKEQNPDIKTNPVQDLKAYLDYIDSASELIVLLPRTVPPHASRRETVTVLSELLSSIIQTLIRLTV